MDLHREIARTLSSNEMARLCCHNACPYAKNCDGLEARVLERLLLLGPAHQGYELTELGEDVAQHSERGTTLGGPPNLKD